MYSLVTPDRLRAAGVAAGLLASLAGGGGSAVPVVTRDAPAAALVGVTSDNWSGYVTTAGPFSVVSARWVQPAASCPAGATLASFWVGLDGDGSPTVEQTGTTADCAGGAATYHAWWEMFPGAEVDYATRVAPGDEMSASVTASGTRYALTVSDATRAWSRTVHVLSAVAERHSAEVIAEAPSVGGVVQPLTDFASVGFGGAEVDHRTLGRLAPSAVTMVAGSVVKAQPSPLRPGGDFSVSWRHI